MLTERLKTEGHLAVPGAVDRALVDRALLAIHRNLSVKGLHPDRLLEYENASYCPELRDDPDILALFGESRLRTAAERLLGALEPVTYAQIALRFPRPEGAPGPEPHLDGVAAPHNGVAEGAIETFSALACVYLSEVAADGGAFTVWPGSHLAHADYFARHGPEALLTGMPPVARSAPRPLVGRAGDGFLVHYLVGHAVGVHRAPAIRYAVFFRLRAAGHASRGRRTMVEPWLEWRV